LILDDRVLVLVFFGYIAESVLYLVPMIYKLVISQ